VRVIFAAACLALCSTSALSAEFGLGVSAKSDDGWIYVPIEINDKYRVEPSVRYQSSEFSYSDPAGMSSDAFRRQESDTLELGIGVFRLMKVAESAQFYFGGRVAYVDTKTTLGSTITYIPGPIISTQSETSQDGYRIGPAIGFEYLFGEHFSIGAEASYTFLDLEGESGVGSSFRTEIEQKSNGTDTQFIFRYRF